MKKLLQIIPVIAIMLLLVKGCGFDNPAGISSNENKYLTDAPGDTIVVFKRILNESNVQIGNLEIRNDLNNFYFTFIVPNNKYIKNIRLSSKTALSHIPIGSNQCPNTNNFEKKVLNLPNTTHTYVVTLPFSSISLQHKPIYTSAQIDIEPVSANYPDCTVGWVEGNSFPGCTAFAKYFIHKLVISITPKVSN